MIRENLKAFSVSLTSSTTPLFQVDTLLAVPDVVLHPGTNEVYKLVLQCVRDCVEGSVGHERHGSIIKHFDAVLHSLLLSIQQLESYFGFINYCSLLTVLLFLKYLLKSRNVIFAAKHLIEFYLWIYIKYIYMYCLWMQISCQVANIRVMNVPVIYITLNSQ